VDGRPRDGWWPWTRVWPRSSGNSSSTAPKAGPPVPPILHVPTAWSLTTSDIAPSLSEPTEGDGETVWARVSPGRLVLAGLTGGRVGVVAAVLGFVSQVIPEAWWPALFGEAMGRVPDPSTLEGLRFLSLLGAGAILTAFVFSVLATVVAHWGFTLSASRSGGDSWSDAGSSPDIGTPLPSGGSRPSGWRRTCSGVSWEWGRFVRWWQGGPAPARRGERASSSPWADARSYTTWP
jgi:hypothetical protein